MANGSDVQRRQTTRRRCDDDATRHDDDGTLGYPVAVVYELVDSGGKDDGVSSTGQRSPAATEVLGITGQRSPAATEVLGFEDDIRAHAKKRTPVAVRRREKRQRLSDLKRKLAAEERTAVHRAEIDEVFRKQQTDRARRAFEAFHGRMAGNSTEAEIIKSSSGISGWARYAEILEGVVKSEYGDTPSPEVNDRQRELQDQLIQGLGIKDEVIRKALELKREQDEIFVGIHSAVNLCERSIGASEVLVAENWDDIEFEVALDSGSVDHVCDELDTPGYALEASESSKRGGCFIVGKGEHVPNKGQKVLNLEAQTNSSVTLRSCFQIAKVTRPLMSVGRICENKMRVIFDEEKAVVENKADRAHVCTFTRSPGGLYLCKMRLKSPFGRLG